MRAANRAADRVVTVLAVVALGAGAAIIGVQRARYDRHYYISELGAEGLPSEEGFRIGFVLVCVGIALAAWSLRSLRARARWLSLWLPAVSLGASSAAFLVASQVNCSEGCPALLAEGSQPRDLVHIAFAIMGFVAGCFAMLQIADSAERWLRLFSVTGGVAVGGIAAVGGLLSLAGGDTDLGSTMEFVAAGLGLVWLAGVAVAHAWRRREEADPAPQPAAVDEARVR